MINYIQVVLLKTISSKEEKMHYFVRRLTSLHNKSRKVLFSKEKIVINVFELYQQFILGFALLCSDT